MAQVEQATSKKGKKYLVSGITTFEDVQATNISADNITSGTMSADKIKGGTLTLGGLNNVNGTLEVLNASGQVMGTISGSAMSIKSYDTANPTFRLYNEAEDEYAFMTNKFLTLKDNGAETEIKSMGDGTNAISNIFSRANSSYIQLESHSVVSEDMQYSMLYLYGHKNDNNYSYININASKSGGFIQITEKTAGTTKQLYLSPTEITIAGGTGVTTTCTVKQSGVDKTMTIKNGIITSIA